MRCSKNNNLEGNSAFDFFLSESDSIFLSLNSSIRRFYEKHILWKFKPKE